MSVVIAPEISSAAPSTEDKIIEFERTAGKVLADSAHYRSLMERFHTLLNKDASLLQGLAIRGENKFEGDSVPITAKREQWRNFTPIYSSKPPTDFSGTIYTNVRIGYLKGQTFSRIGGVSWIAVSEQGKITHVGFSENKRKAEETKKQLEEHLFGFEVSPQFEKRLEYIYSKLFKELNKPYSSSSKKLNAFLEKRDHSPKWKKAGGFGYYSPELFDAKKFKEKYNITDDELYRAGIMELTISKDGITHYTKRKDECVLIPFRREAFSFLGIKKYEICNWRMRVINPKKGAAKYLSHPFIRSFKQLPTVQQEMYNAHLLSDVKGKDIFFTEGEFKCHVATQKTGFVTVGIPGITMVTDAMLDSLIDSGARSLTLALDADTRSKSAKRVDGITDSERAAYEIAWRYERRITERKAAGTLKGPYPTVKIGILSVTDEGDKQGLDDWLIPMSDTEAKKSMMHLRDTALTVSEYAAHIGYAGDGLNETLGQLKIVKTETRATLRGIKHCINRLFGNYTELDLVGNPKLAELVSLQENFEAIYSDIESTHVRGLWALYNRGRLNLPGRKHRFLPAKEVPRKDKKAMYCPLSGQNVIDQASGDIISAEVYFSDMPEREKSPDAEGESLPYSMRETFAYFCGRGFDRQIYEDFQRGIKALKIPGDESTIFNELQRVKDLNRFVNIICAGFLSRSFTLDEFSFSEGLPCIVRGDRFIEEFTKIELAIFSTRWNQLEMTVAPVIFAPSLDNFSPSHPSSNKYSHDREILSDEVIKEMKKNYPSNPQRASLIAGAKGTRIRSFLRDPTLELQRNKFRQIVAYMSGDEYGRERAKSHWAQYGLSEAAVDQAGLSTLTAEDFRRLQKIFNKRKLLNQAMLSGFFRMTPEGKIVPTFRGEVQILPSQTPTSLSMRVGISGNDLDNKRIEPTEKAFHVLRGARATAPSMDPTSHLFMGSNLSRAKDKTVVLCYNERDAILLNDYLPKSRFAVCALNSDFTPRAPVISQIKRSACKNVIVIGKPNAERRYEGLLLDEAIPLELPELIDLERRFSAERSGEVPKQLSWFPITSDVSEWIRHQYQSGNPKENISSMLAEYLTYQGRRPSEVSLPTYGLKISEFAVLARLARAREEYEHCIEAIGKPTSSDTQRFTKALHALEKAINAAASMYKGKNYEFPDTIATFLKFSYPWTRSTLPSTEDEYLLFKQQSPMGFPLRRIYRGIDTGSTSNRRIATPQPVSPNLIDESWNDSAMIENIQKEARAAKKTDYKHRLQEMLSIAIKNNLAIPTTADTQKMQYRIKTYEKNRAHSSYARDQLSQSSNKTIGALTINMPGLAAAEVFVTINTSDGPQIVSFYGQGSSKEAAEQLAAKYACIYLGSLKLEEKRKIKFEWVQKYERPRLKKYALRKKEQKKIRLETQKQIKFKDGIDGSLTYGFRAKQ